MPNIKNLYQQFSPQGFKIIYIAKEHSSSDLRFFTKRFSPPFPILLNSKRIDSLFNYPSAVPSYFIVDSTGLILHKSVGHIPYTELKEVMTENKKEK